MVFQSLGLARGCTETLLRDSTTAAIVWFGDARSEMLDRIADDAAGADLVAGV